MLDSKVLVVILLLAVIVFGSKRLRSIGSDLGGAIKGFHRAVHQPSGAEWRPRDSEDR